MQLLRRSTLVLREISAHPGGLTLQELVTRLGIPLASMHRLLAALSEERLVARSSSTRRYVIGPTIHRLAANCTSRANVADVARPHLEALRRDVAETAVVSQLLGDRVVCVAMAEGAQEVSLFLRVGEEMPLHATAAARAILAYWRPAFVRKALSARRLPAFTDCTPTDVEAILRALPRIRAQGYDTSEAEVDPEVWSVAAPIGSPGGEVEASIAVSAPKHRLASATARREAIQRVQFAARAVSSDLAVSGVGAAAGLGAGELAM